MKNRPLLYRVWDAQRKEMGTVVNIQMQSDGSPRLVSAMFGKEAVARQLDKDFVIMAYIGLNDDAKKPIYEEDIVEVMVTSEAQFWSKAIRAKVIWNPHVSYGSYGFVLIDSDGGIHSFDKTGDFIVVKGNTFEGCK